MMIEKMLVGIAVLVLLGLFAGALYLKHRGYCVSSHTCTAGYRQPAPF